MEPRELIDLLGLVPLEREGGMYRSTYKAAETYGGRPVGGAIYYLLSGKAFSHLHLLDADEIYHFYLGAPVELYQLEDNTGLTKVILGPDIAAGQRLQAVVPRGVWQGSRLAGQGTWALMGTTMAPAYVNAGYTHGIREELESRFPQHTELIRALTGKAVFR